MSQIKLLFDSLVIELVWYILKQLFTSVSVKVVDVYQAVVNYENNTAGVRYNAFRLRILFVLLYVGVREKVCLPAHSRSAD